MKIKDKEFEVYLSEETLHNRITELADQLNQNYSGKRPLFIAILNGSFIFASDLFKQIDVECNISFIKLSSYEEMESTGSVKTLLGLNENVFGRHVVIIEDIIDTGHTMKSVLDEFRDRGVSSVEVVTLLMKPEALQTPLDIKYVGFEIPNAFVVGYGLDYDGYGRNTKALYQIKS